MKKLLMAMVLAPMMTLAYEWTDPATGIKWSYVISGNTATVCSGVPYESAIPAPTGGEIVIPEKLGGKPVTGIGPYAFYGCRGLVSVTIPKSVTSVGLNAFGGCSSLKTVYIGKTGDVDCVKRMLAMSGIDFSVVTVDRSDGPLVAVAASVYDGWISDANGLVIGSVQVKVAKGKKDRSTGVFSAKVTASVQLADGSGKISFRGGTVDSTGVVTEMTDKKGHRLEVVLGARALGGAFDGVCQLDGARNVFSGKSSEDKTAAAAALPYQDSYNVAFGGGTLSVAVGKKGKTKVSGTVDGVKVSAQSQLVVGDGVTGVPVVIARKKARLAFCLRLAEDGGAEVAGIDPGRYIKDADPLPAGKAGAIADDARIVLDAEAVDKLQGWFSGLYLDCLPKSVGVAQDGKKWVVAAGAKAGKLVLVKGTTEIDSEKSAFTDNMSGLKLSYRPKDGSFRGSFKIFALEKGKIRSYVATVTGLMIGQKGYGTAAVKKLGTVAVAIVGKEGAQ